VDGNHSATSDDRCGIQVPNFNTISQSVAELLMIQQIFQAHCFGGDIIPSGSQYRVDITTAIFLAGGEGTLAIIDAFNKCIRFHTRCFCSNQSASSLKIEATFWTFDPEQLEEVGKRLSQFYQLRLHPNLSYSFNGKKGCSTISI